MIIPKLDQSPNILSVLRLSLLVAILPFTSRAETPPLVESEPILVQATKGRFDCLRIDEQFDRLLADHTGNGTLGIYQNIKSQPVTLVIDPAANSIINSWSTNRQKACTDWQSAPQLTDFSPLAETERYRYWIPAPEMY